MRGDPENPLRVMHQEVSLSDLADAQPDALRKFAEAMLKPEQR